MILITAFPLQYWCYVVELIPAFAVGAQLTYGTIALPEHQKTDADIALDIDIGSWFGE